MILALAGRRIDSNDADEVRFPLRNAGPVSRAVAKLISENGVTALVTSAACGADLIGLSEAGKLGIRRRVVLPFSREKFRAESVVDRPGEWGHLYDMILDDVSAIGDLVIQTKSLSADPYLGANMAILDEAVALGLERKDEVAAVIVWDGTPRGEPDYTADFAERSKERGIRVFEVRTD